MLVGREETVLRMFVFNVILWSIKSVLTYQVSYTSIAMTTVFLTRILLVLENGHVEFVGKRLIGHVRLILVHVALVMLFIQNVQQGKTCGMA